MDHVTRIALRTSLGYALLGAIWIIVSDRLVAAYVENSDWLVAAQTAKGWLFIAVSATLLHVAMLTQLRRLKKVASERDRLHRQSRETEAMWREVFDASSDAMLVLDEKGRILEANAAAGQLYGYDRSKLTEMHLVDLRSEADRVKFEQQAKSAIEKDGARWEALKRRGDGTEILVEAGMRSFVTVHGRRFVHVARDVTERRQLEAEREMKARMLDFIGEAVIGTDPRGKVIYANEAAKSLYGWPGEEMLGLSIFEVTVPTENRPEAESIMEHLRAGRIWLGKFRVRRRDGSTFVAQVSSAPVHDAKGRLVAIIGATRDLTEEEATAERLREAEADARKLFEDSPLPMWVFDRQTLRFLAVNEAAVRKYGYTREEFMEMTIKEIRPPEDVPALLESLAKDASGLDEAGTWRHRRRDGTIMFVRITSHTMQFSGREAELVLADDVTTEVENERRLRESNSTLQTIIYTAPVPMAACDRKGTLVLWNPAAEKLFGWSASEAVGRRAVMIAEDQQAEFERIMKQTAEDEGIAGRLVRRRRKNGEWLDLLLYTAPIRDTAGRVRELLAMYVDITERKRVEDSLREAEEQLHALVNRLNTARDDEGRRISRELHDALGQQLTALNLELERLFSRLDPATAARHADRRMQMEALIEETIRTVQSIAGDLRLGQLDLLGLPGALKLLLSDFQERSGIECRTNRFNDELELPKDRAVAAYRIVQEALTNIARHAGATLVELELWREGGKTVLRVRDNGRGLTPGESGSRESLGLLGMRERAQAAGGTIEFDGRERMGTTVSLTFPDQPL